MISRDASEEVINLRKQANDAEMQAEAAVKAQSLLHDIESNYLNSIKCQKFSLYSNFLI